MTQRLSESLEDYLEAIAELITIEGHAHTKDIAHKLGVKMPSVTGALRALVEKKLIEYNANHPVVLTPAGRREAERILHRHQVLGRFFVEILGLRMQKASDTACHLEHVIDEDTVDRFVLFSKAVESRADARSLKTYLTEAFSVLAKGDLGNVCVLSELPMGETAVVEQIGRNLEGREIPVAVGDSLTLDGISLDKTQLSLKTSSDRILDMPVAVAENIWVRRINR